jgi:hypothetical protein
MAFEEWRDSETYRQYQQTEEYKVYQGALAHYNQYRELEEKNELAQIADLIAFIHLFNWPVIEPERMPEVRKHLLEMIRLSRESWRRIQAETDDDREWIPGPSQRSALVRLRTTEERVAGWHTFLDEFEAILDGRRLIKHWRFVTRGVNLRRMFEEPRTFDPVMIAQGSAVLPYLEKGDLVSANTTRTLLDVFEGDFFAYFVWFN